MYLEIVLSVILGMALGGLLASLAHPSHKDLLQRLDELETENRYLNKHLTISEKVYNRLENQMIRQFNCYRQPENVENERERDPTPYVEYDPYAHYELLSNDVIKFSVTDRAEQRHVSLRRRR